MYNAHSDLIWALRNTLTSYYFLRIRSSEKQQKASTLIFILVKKLIFNNLNKNNNVYREQIKI